MRVSDPFLRQASERGWKVEGWVRGIAGALVLGSLVLSLIKLRWLWLTAFIGANLLQSSFTGWCLMSNLLAITGVGSKRDA
jgi:hypothetical protein